jgi:hypothetical protein
VSRYKKKVCPTCLADAQPKRFTEIGQSECDISTFSVRLILQPQQLARFPAERGGAYFRILDGEETEFYQNPCIVPPCGHLLILEMVMSISGYNSVDDEGSIIGLRSVAEPLHNTLRPYVLCNPGLVHRLVQAG